MYKYAKIVKYSQTYSCGKEKTKGEKTERASKRHKAGLKALYK